MNEWARTFAGSGAADNLLRRVDRRLEELDRGEIPAARKAVKRWRKQIDLEAVPKDVSKDLERLFHAAWMALREPPDIEAARAALKTARGRVTP